MMSCIDSTVQGIMSAISDNGFVGNTLVFFAGDNGGAPKNGGYNWPMRGSKGTLYEGGIRQASWVWGSMLDESRRGTIYHGQIHLVDMMPTFLGLATGGHSPRTETLLNVIGESGGLRWGNWSLLYNC